jgi:hypothetical protein
LKPAGRRISSGCSTYSGLLLEHIQHPNPPTQKATMAMITMYQIWARPQPTDTETRWIKIGQIATGYTFIKACDVAARHDNSFPEDKIAILPVENVPRAKPHEPPW